MNTSPDAASQQPQSILPAGFGQHTERALVRGTPALVEELVRLLTLGEVFDNPKLNRIGESFLQGTRGMGTFTPRDIYDAMETAVTIYLLHSGLAREGLETDRPRDFITQVLKPLTKRLPRQTDRTQEHVELQQFSTPPTIAYLAARALNPRPEDIAMEPSAGTAALALWLLAAACAEVLTNEIAPRRCALLELAGFSPTTYDGEYLHDLLPREIRPTAFLTNPPFSSTGGRVRAHRSIYGANHLTSDLRRLERGGRLVAISTGYMALSRPGFAAWWKQVINRYNVRANLTLPGGEYSKYGTHFETQLIVIDKTGPTPGETLREQLSQIVWGTCGSVEEAMDRLGEVAATRPDVALYAREEANDEEEQDSVIVLSEPEPEQEELADDEQEQEKAPTRFDALEIIAAPDEASAPSSPAATPAEDDGTTEQAKLKQAEGEPAAPVYVPYVTRKLVGGREHPADLVEAATMACVDPPDIHYRPHLQPAIITEGRLSRVQLERVIYAGQRHEQRLFDGARAGFFNGDGTGAGKGRSNSGVILDNWNQGRRRALWLSVSQNLIEDARRDLNDLGVAIPLAQINDYSAGGEITLREGVIFCTYSTLISKSKQGKTRLAQLRRWLDDDSVVIIDECHKAKNALNTGKGAPTLTGQAVIDLQDPTVSPDYRIVYSSATGATDVRNMAYMTRLGLWGLGTSFGSFEEFLSQIEDGGIGAMELVCRDMKALGMYLSASISYEGVEYTETKHILTEKQREMYNAAAHAWQGVLTNFNGALECTGAGTRQRGRAMQGFWSRHQRFFRLLISAFKVPTVIREAERALAGGRSVIISLIGTGEARTKDQVQEALAHGGLIEDLDFSPLEIIVEAVNSCFPTVVYEDQTDEQTGKTTQVPVERDGQIVHSQEALDLKQETLDSLQVLELPENPLDQLVNHWGVSQVAEITGRKRRLVRNERTGAIEYKKRAPEGIAMKRVNLYERQQYQDGKKRVAIISKASSTGISLHADNRAQNRQQREFLTLELSWSADEQIQMFGRGHRTDQAHPPVYNLVSTELGGEVRFSSTIARRLGSLGALTKGDRGAVDNELAKYNFETIYGKAALKLLFKRIVSAGVSDEGEIVEQVEVPGLDDPRQTLRDMGLLVENSDGVECVRDEDRDNVPRFLNRVLALDVDRQNSIFNYFSTLFDEVIAHAKSTGTFDEGVQDIHAVAIRVSRPPTVVHTDHITGATTSHFTLEIEVPTDIVPFDELLKRWQGRDYSFYEHKETGLFIACTPSSRHTDPNGNTHRFFAVTRPNGWRMDYMAEEMLTDKYRVCHPERAREWWQMMVALLPDTEKYTQHIISGAIISMWERIQGKDGDPLQVVRVTTDSGERIVGIAIHASRITKVLDLLGVHHDLSSTPEIFRSVLEEGARVELIGDLALKRSTINQENRIELVGAHPFRFRELRAMGLIQEIIKHRQRFFIPTIEDAGCDILTRLFERYPPLDQKQKAEGAEAAEQEEAAEPLMLSTTLNVFDLNDLIRNPAEIAASSATTHADDTLFATLERATPEPVVFVEAHSRAATAPPKPPEPDALTRNETPGETASLFAAAVVTADESVPAEVAGFELNISDEQLRIEEEQAETCQIAFVQTTHGPAITRAQVTVSEKKVRRRRRGVHEDQLGFDFLSTTPPEREATAFFS